MKVSILIPTLNRFNYLKDSLASACAQTHPDIEILVSDDGSTDCSREYVQRVASTDNRVRLLPPNPHQGLYENYNYLIEHAGGEAFGILDDDDRWLPDMVERLVVSLAERPETVASFCDHWIIAPDGARMQEETDENSVVFGRAALPGGPLADPVSLTMTGGLSVVFALFRTAALRREHFDLGCAGAADLDYALRVALSGAELYYVDARLGEYRVYHSRTTTAQTRWMLDGAVTALEKHTFDDPRHEERRRRRLLAAYRTKAIYVCTRDRAAWRETMQAYRRAGGSVRHWVVVLSGTLCALPHDSGERARELLKWLRAKYQADAP